MRKITTILAIVALLSFAVGVDAQDPLPCRPNPVPCVLSTMDFTSPAIIPEIQFVAEYPGELPVTVHTMADVPIGQEFDVDVPVPKTGEVEIIAFAYDDCGVRSDLPPVSTVHVRVTDPLVGSCGLRLR